MGRPVEIAIISKKSLSTSSNPECMMKPNIPQHSNIPHILQVDNETPQKLREINFTVGY